MLSSKNRDLREPLYTHAETPSCWSSCWKKTKVFGLAFLFITTPIIAGFAGYKIAGVINKPFDPNTYNPDGADLLRYNHERCGFLGLSDQSILNFNSNEAHVINYSYKTLESSCQNAGDNKDYTWHNVWTYDPVDERHVMALGVWAGSREQAKQRAFDFAMNSNPAGFHNYGEFVPKFKEVPEVCVKKTGNFASCENNFVNECEQIHLITSKEWPLGKDPKDGDVTKNPNRFFAKRDKALDVSDEELANSVFARSNTALKLRP